MRILKTGKNSNEITSESIEKVFNVLGDKLKERINFENFDIKDNWFELIQGTSGIVDDIYYCIIGMNNIVICKTCDIDGFENFEM